MRSDPRVVSRMRRTWIVVGVVQGVGLFLTSKRGSGGICGRGTRVSDRDLEVGGDGDGFVQETDDQMLPLSSRGPLLFRPPKSNANGVANRVPFTSLTMRRYASGSVLWMYSGRRKWPPHQSYPLPYAPGLVRVRTRYRFWPV